MTEPREKSAQSRSPILNKRYGDYREIDQQWVDSIPSHWDLSKIKRHFEVQVGKMLQSDKESPTEKRIPYLKARHIRENGEFDLADLPEMWFQPEERSKYRLREEDVLVTEGGDVGRAAIWEETDLEVCYQNALNRIRPLNDASPRFLYYWITFLKQQGFIEVICDNATISHYTTETVEETPFLFAPPQEQEAIADFLDYYINKVNYTIKKKNRLIGLC